MTGTPGFDIAALIAGFTEAEGWADAWGWAGCADA